VAAPWTERAPETEPVALREPEPLVVESVAAEPLVEAVATPAPEPTPIVIAPEVVAVPEVVATAAPAPTFEPVVPQLTTRPAAVDTVPSMAPGHVLTGTKQPERERVSFKDLADSLLGAMTATQEALAQTTVDATAKPAIAEPLVLESAAPSEPVEIPLTLELEKPVAKTTEPAATPQPVPTSPAIEELLALATEALETKTAPALTVENASPAPEPAAAPERPLTETGKPAAPTMPQGFEGLKFPNDGVLTRQWMEFLSQMSTTK
jgi:nicotinate-nucleotide--dimethylbenzimidazole phosphoribosyltransferase